MTEIETMTAGRAAAEWWAEQIGAPIHKIVEDDAIGEDREIGDTTFLLMGLLASGHPVHEGQGEKFAEALATVIDERLTRFDYMSLGVDYGPDRELAEAADVAGIHYSRFPFKTHMWIRRDHVTASLGYRGATRLIWNAPDWLRPQCGSQRYEETEGRYRPFDEICPLPRYHEEDHGSWVSDPARCKTCGGTYTQHYATDEYVGHSWEPTTDN